MNDQTPGIQKQIKTLAGKAEPSGGNKTGFIEYICKNNVYLLPPGSVIYGEGTSGYVEIGRKRITNLTPYLYKGIPDGESQIRIGFPVTGYGSSLIEEYKEIEQYLAKKQQHTFFELEHVTGTKIALCTFFKPDDAERADALTKHIAASMPFLINIFRRPLIHLQQAELVQPVDAVKRVNHLTVRHLSQHPEHWKTLDEEKNIVPARLLTKVYEDDYSIYENVVFCNLIDQISAFLQRRIFVLTEILETFTNTLNLDSVNMFNHRKYYLAIGKLYVGFYGMDDSAGIKQSVDTARHLYRELSNYKNRAVYTKNAKLRIGAGEIKSTNILTMHKDYKHVLNLSRMLRKQTVRNKEAGNLEKQARSQQTYSDFCFMLTLFSASNFNFDCISDGPVLLSGSYYAEFQYKDWNLTFQSTYSAPLGFDIITMTMTNRGTTMKAALIPMSYHFVLDSKRKFEQICKRLYAAGGDWDKFVFFTPFDTDEDDYGYLHTTAAFDKDLEYAILPVSITELNSFRRIQKVFLEMMVKTNRHTDVCPFCGATLKKLPHGGHTCVKCKMVIAEPACTGCGKTFAATYVDAKNQENEDTYKDLPDFLRQEKLYHFRNIVNMYRNRFICPHCKTENSK